MKSTRLIAAAATALCLVAGGRADPAPASADANVRPQDNFYRYANGAWLKTTPIPGDSPHWGTIDVLKQANLENLHLLCERASAQGNDATPIEQKVGDFYASGMDEAAINDAGVQPLGFEFDRIVALATPADVLGEIGHLHTLGVSAGFMFEVEDNAGGDGTVAAALRQGGLGLPERDYYFREDEKSKALRALYVAHISRMFQLLGDPAKLADVGAAAVMRLETDLARGSLGLVALRDPSASHRWMTLADAGSQVPGLDLALYFSKAGAPPPQGLDLAQPDFFKAFAKALEERPVDDWKSYLRWHVIHQFAPYLGDDFSKEDFAFYGTALTGARRVPNRWKFVVETIDRAVGDALGQLYVADYFPPDSKTRVMKLATDIRGALRARLQTIDWMDETTRTRALAKLDALNVMIGYPDNWRDYGELLIDRGPFVLNVLKSNAFEARRALREIGRPIDETEWKVTPETVTAYYDPARNEIVLPAAVLQPPLFDPGADDAANYGAIGAVIGRELIHGFDETGGRLGGKGSTADWWTPGTAARFRERAAAIVRQYDDYRVFPDLHVNGVLTERENIADLGGLKLAYAALEADLQGQPRDTVGGLTPEQRFFLSFASMCKERYRPDALRLLVNTSPEAPPEFRCNGPLSNLDEFAAAFSVPEGAPMRRPASERVSIW